MKSRPFNGSFSITTAETFRTASQPRWLLLFVITFCALCGPLKSAFAEVPLASVVINKSTVYGPRELFEIYKLFIGKPANKTTARSIADALRDRYRQDGYSRPGYTVADDGVTSGIARINLVEPNISAVNLSGDSGPHRERLKSLFAALPSGHSLRPVDIREVVQQARRLPGLDVNVATRPDNDGHGGFVLDVDSAYRAITGSVTLTNRGTEQIGRNLAFARIVSNGPFGGDNSVGMFLVTAQSSNDYSSGGLFFKSALGQHNTSVFVQGSVASLQIVSSGIVVDQDRERYQLKVSQPLPEWGNRRLSLWGALEVDNLDVSYNDTAAREDHLRSLDTGVTMSWRNGARQHLVGVDTEFGLDGFGARLDNHFVPDDGRRGDYALLRLHYVDLTALTEAWSLRLDAYAQHSPHVLPSIKRFKVGGGRIGRGFDAAALRGDRGLGGKLELRRRLADGVTLLDRVDAYGFYDIGAAWRNDLSGRESAASAGVGLSVRSERLDGYLEFAEPLTHSDADGRKEVGIFVQLTGRF